MITRKKGWRRLWIKGDSKIIINSLNGGVVNNYNLGILIDEARMIQCSFEETQTYHIGKGDNKVADWLANQGVCGRIRVGNGRAIWWINFPYIVLRLIQEDIKE
ncbi:hypothetical protein SUGI_0404230 [Cryptomeria japonica]|nr:hypothetical protein SUGI_0404230 [Cryptomeria japonica]